MPFLACSPILTPSDPEPILPQTCIVASWEVEARVHRAKEQQPDPGGGPLNRLFVTESARSQVLQWGHSSKFTCHPGSAHTLEILHQRFWWPTMKTDT